MSQSFKFRYVNQIVGTFVLLTVLLVVVSVVMIAFSRRWFTPIHTIVLKIPSGLSTDLRPGAEVVIGGTVAGTVQYTNPDPADPSATIATLSLPSNFMASVHADSRIEIRRTLGGVGDAYVKISGGSGPAIRSGAAIVVVDKNIEANPTEIAQQMIREVAVPMLQSITKVADGINDPNGNLQQSLAHANHIAATIDQGQGLAGRLINDPKLADQVAQTLPKINASLERLEQLLQDTQKTTSQFPQLAASLNKDMDQVPAALSELRGSIKQVNLILADVEKTTSALPQTTRNVNQTMELMPGVVLQTQETLRQLQRLAESAQKSWLLHSSNVPESPSNSRLASDRVSQ